MSTGPILWLHQLGMQDLEQVGGKNASLGEMIRHLSEAGVSVPGGFATTADAYREFLNHNGLAERIEHVERLTRRERELIDRWYRAMEEQP